MSEEVTSVVEPISIHQMVTEACQSALEEMQSDTERTRSPEGPKRADEAPETMNIDLSVSGRGSVGSAMECSFNEAGEEPKHFSSEDSSEEEEHERDSRSILPPSVLGQASLIVGHLMNGQPRCNGLVADDGGGSYSCTAPKVTSRQGSLENSDKSPRSRGTHDDWQSSDVVRGSNLQEKESPSDEAHFNSLEDLELDMDRNFPKRRDSTLSKQDRLLIEKIKSYYDNAEHEDANFSIKRRESLTYIPAGLVRNSVSKLNCQNKEENLREATLRRRLASSTAAVARGDGPPALALRDLPNPSASGDARLSPESCQVLESQQLEARDTLVEKPPLDSPRETSPGQQDPITENEFRSPVDMIKIWQEMESMSNAASKSPKGTGQKHETSRGFNFFEHSSETPKKRECKSPVQSQMKHLSKGRTSFGQDFNEPLVILEDSDISAIAEVSPVSSKSRSTGESGLEERLNDVSISDVCTQTKATVPLAQTPLHEQPRKWSEAEDNPTPLPESSSHLMRRTCDHPAPITGPKIVQAQSEELLREVTEKMKTKVFQLARIYSQRIKNSKPVVRKRGKLLEDALVREEERVSEAPKLITVEEEEKEKVAADKPKELPHLSLYEQVIIHEQVPLAVLVEEPDVVSPTKELQTCLSPSSRITSPRRSVISLTTPPVRLLSRRPLSPTEVETFLWPDVRELRSKYTPARDLAAKDSTLRIARTNLFKPGESSCAKLSRFAKSVSMPNGMMEGRMSHSSFLEQKGKSKPGSYSSSTAGKRAASGTGARKMLHSDSSIQYFLQAAPESSSSNHTMCPRTTPLDCRLTGSDHKHCHSTTGTDTTPHASSELTLQDDHKVIIMEKSPHHGDGRSSHRNRDVAEYSSSDDEGYVQIRSPTSREKISIRAVVERCRAYQESDEYKSRQEDQDKGMSPGTSNPKAKQRSCRGAEKVTCSTVQQPGPRFEMCHAGTRTDLTQQGLVKNLREKFQSLTSAT